MLDRRGLLAVLGRVFPGLREEHRPVSRLSINLAVEGHS